MCGRVFLLATSVLLALSACDSQPNERPDYQLLQPLDTLRIDPRDGELRVDLADRFESSGSDPLVYQTRILDGTAVDVRIESDQLVVTPLKEGEARITVGIAHSDGAGAFTSPTVIVWNPCPADIPAGAAELFPVAIGKTWTFSVSEVRYGDRPRGNGTWTLGHAHLTVDYASECADDNIAYRIREVRTDSISAVVDGRPTREFGPARRSDAVYTWTVTDSTITSDAREFNEAGFVFPPPPIAQAMPRWVSSSELFGTRKQVYATTPFVEHTAYAQLEKDVGPTYYRWMTAKSTRDALAYGVWSFRPTTRHP